jgi:hypothetical protein
VRFPAGAAAGQPAVADFNADGIPDVALATGSGAAVLLGTGGGRLAAPIAFPTGSEAFGLAVADFNADGLPDLAVADLDTHTVSVLLDTATPATTASPGALAFGAQPLGTVGPVHNVTVGSTGDRALRVRGVSVAGGDFLVVADGCTGVVGPGATCAIGVRFAPQAIGARTGTLAVATDAGTRTVALSGRGTGLPRGPAGAPGPSGWDGSVLAAAFGAGRYRAVHGRRLRIRYVTTLAAQVTAQVRGTHVKRTARRGRNVIVIRAPRRRGRYTLRLTAVAGAQRATDRATLTVR